MRGVRRQMTAIVAVIGLVVVGLVVTGYIVGHQRLTPPSWVPVVGDEHFYLDARFTTAAGVLPGQGHAVTVSGVKVGEIDGVRLDHGDAVLRLRLDEHYGKGRVHPDATMLLRPKTGLKDMVVELNPGTAASGRALESGATLDTDATEPDVNLDEILSVLDGDTRNALLSLVQGGGTALRDDGGRELAGAFRRFEPLSRHTAQATKLVAQRRQKLEHVMHNLSLLAGELGSRDRQLASFVRNTSSVFRHFASQNEHFAQTLQLLPGALQDTSGGLEELDKLSRTLNTGLTDLAPAAKSLGPTLRKTRPFLRDTVPILRDQLRPFAREAQPTARKLTPVAHDLASATPDLKTLTDVLNGIFDEMAYDPPGDGPTGQSYLFNVPWANHNTNSVMAGQDGLGPIRRGLVLMSCGSLQLLESLATPKRNPTLSTLIQLLNAPDRASHCPPPPTEAAP